MIILKFGGTSVGNADNIRNVAKIISSHNENIIVVLSAMAGTTNSLLEIANLFRKRKNDEALIIINNLQKDYLNTVQNLFVAKANKEPAIELINEQFHYVKNFALDNFGIIQERQLLAQGELISTALFHLFCLEQNIESTFLSALDFMRIDKIGEPDEFYIKEKLNDLLSKHNYPKIIITQGFICRNAYGEIDNLKRGGSDYSATLIGTAVNAKEIQIWTDIDGFHNNDPRYVEHTTPISEMSYDVAAELAYFGAKILHPSSVLPAKSANIPLRLKNTMKPKAEGTLISDKAETIGIKAIAAKNKIIAINIKSDRMLMAYGFLRKVFEIFERYKTPIDMITTSEIALSVTIDKDKYLDIITDELRQFGAVEIDEEQTIICIAGNFKKNKKGIAAQIIDALSDIPLRMISYGGSQYNISVLIDSKYLKQALNELSNNLFNTEG